jgi:KinB signaling pathway activation protein
MTLKRVFFWVWSTLLVGGVSVFLFTPFIQVQSYLQQLLVGLTLASVAELGFFSYLIFNWLCKGQLKSRKTFYLIQIGLIFIVLLNFTYLCMHRVHEREAILLLAIVLSASLLTAYVKSKCTHNIAWLPTCFFMVVATILEATPSFQTKLITVPFTLLLQTVSVLLVCNAWQILQLHKWVQK